MADPQLEGALERRFQSRIERLGGVDTDRCHWELFVGKQMCRASGASVHMIVVNNVDVEEEYQRQGIFRQGIRLLMERFAVVARAPILELNCVLNRHLYAWALRQPNVYVSPYQPGCVHIYLDFAETAPPELRAQAAELRTKLHGAHNMANRCITPALLDEIGRARLAAEKPDEVAAYSLAHLEMSRAYLPPMALHAACSAWIVQHYQSTASS